MAPCSTPHEPSVSVYPGKESSYVHQVLFAFFCCSFFKTFVLNIELICCWKKRGKEGRREGGKEGRKERETERKIGVNGSVYH